MKVYVVIEDDRGCGVSIVGVYTNKDKALKVADESSHYELREEELNEEIG